MFIGYTSAIHTTAEQQSAYARQQTRHTAMIEFMLLFVLPLAVATMIHFIVTHPGYSASLPLTKRGHEQFYPKWPQDGWGAPCVFFVWVFYLAALAAVGYLWCILLCLDMYGNYQKKRDAKRMHLESAEALSRPPATPAESVQAGSTPAASAPPNSRTFVLSPAPLAAAAPASPEPAAPRPPTSETVTRPDGPPSLDLKNDGFGGASMYRDSGGNT